MRSIVLGLPVIATLLIGDGADTACLRYEEPVTLRGTLVRLSFAEEPNFESVDAGDVERSYFFLELLESFCVAGTPDPDDLMPGAAAVDRVQLAFAGNASESYRRLRASLGSEVRCTGSLFHQISGHHHSEVLLGEAECAATAR